MRRHWLMGSGALLCLLLLAAAGKADEASAIEALKPLSAEFTMDDTQSGKPVVAVRLQHYFLCRKTGDARWRAAQAGPGRGRTEVQLGLGWINCHRPAMIRRFGRRVQVAPAAVGSGVGIEIAPPFKR